MTSKTKLLIATPAIALVVWYAIVTIQDSQYNDCKGSPLAECEARHSITLEPPPSYYLETFPKKPGSKLWVQRQPSQSPLEKFLCIDVDEKTGIVTDVFIYRLWNVAI